MPHELDAEKSSHGPAQEVDGEGLKYEVGTGLVHEFPGDMDPKVELAAASKPAEADGAVRAIYEMPGEDVKFAEMPGDGANVTEMPGDGVPVAEVSADNSQSVLTPKGEELRRAGTGG